MNLLLLSFHLHLMYRELMHRGEEIYSDSLVVYGLDWKLKIYPVRYFLPLSQLSPPTNLLISLSPLLTLLPLRMAIGRILGAIWRSFWSCQKALTEQHGNVLLS